MRRRKPLDPTGLLHPSNQGTHPWPLLLQPEAVDLLADEAFGRDTQAPGAVGGAAAGWDQLDAFREARNRAIIR